MVRGYLVTGTHAHSRAPKQGAQPFDWEDSFPSGAELPQQRGGPDRRRLYHAGLPVCLLPDIAVSGQKAIRLGYAGAATVEWAAMARQRRANAADLKG